MTSELPLLRLLSPNARRHAHHTHTQSTQAPKLFPTFPHPQNLFTSAQSLCLFLLPVIDALSPYIKPLCSPRFTDRNGVAETGLERPASRAPGWVAWLVGWGGEKGSRGKGGEERLWQVIAQHLSLPTSVGNPPSWRMRRLPDQCAVPLGLTSRSTW